MAAAGADLGGFLEAAGRSLSGAQGELVGDELGAPGAVAIAEAELEVKATVEDAGAGKLGLRPVSSRDAREADIDPGLLSTLRIRYVAMADDTLAAPAERPTRTANGVIEEVSGREDVKALDRILGGLEFEATFVPASADWLVTAKDPKNRIVRQVVVGDAGG